MGAPARKIGDLTTLLRRFQQGDQSAIEELLPLVYEHLKRIAANQMRAQSAGHTLSSTALVHEAFLRLRETNGLEARDRSHFYAIAARTMRWILADHGRAKGRTKRGDGAAKVVFDENRHSPDDGVGMVELEAALKKLERRDERLCRVVELRQLVGLSIEETAEALGVSPMTVKRDWSLAKAWLARELGIDPVE